MATPVQNLDIVTVATTLAVAMFGSRELAEIIGPYAVIVGGSVLGASISGAEQGSSGIAQTLAHLAKAAGLALLCTVPLSTFLASYAGFEAKWMFGPVALVVGWRNSQIPADLGWAVALLKRVAQKWGDK